MIQAGFARVDVTPPLGTPVSGYFNERLAKGVRDPIQLNALAFGNGQESAVIIACDVVAIVQDIADELRTLVAERTGIAAERVMICALHQHTSVCLGGRDIFFPVRDSAYLDLFYRKCADVAKMAVDDMSEARVFAAEGESEKPLGFIRRYLREDGSIATNPSAKGPKPVCPLDTADNTVRLLRFVREGKADIAYVNFSTHPDVIGGSRFSADWPGFVRRFVEADNKNVHCISITGFQGDSNHVDFMKPKEERFPEGQGYDHSRYMGRVIADTVKRLWDTGTEHVGEEIAGEIRTVYNLTSNKGFEYTDEAEQYVASYYAGDLKKTEHIRDIATAVRILDLRRAPLYQRVALTMLTLGDILFFGIGGEPFTRYRRIAEGMVKGKMLLCSCCTNGYQGYLPSAKAFAEGGYEVNNTFFTDTLEAECVATMDEMLKKF